MKEELKVNGYWITEPDDTNGRVAQITAEVRIILILVILVIIAIGLLFKPKKER